MKTSSQIGLGLSLIPIAFLAVALILVIVVFGQPPHMALIFACAVAAIIAMLKHHPWPAILDGLIHGIRIAMGAVLILIIIGTMIGTWIIGGIVPAMIYFGLKILSPQIFLVATLIICSIVALGTGSSWSTVGTIGVALIGVGRGLGIPLPMVAGAIVSGAYFGDKMSPLSDTTNLAPAVAGTDLFSHIRHMVYTTSPGYVVSIILFALLGLRFSGGDLSAANIEQILMTLDAQFFIHPVLLLPPILVIVMVIRKTPPLPALMAGMILGGVCAVLAQNQSLAQVIQAAHTGPVYETGMTMVDDLLTRGGLMSMMETVALIMCALSFGGIMEKTGMAETITWALLRRVRRTGSLIAATIASSIGTNLIISNQLIAIVLPGRMFKSAFERKNLHPKNLSRCLEDSATMTSPLIPWNSCGAFMHATLGVSPFLFLPYAFFNLITPVISLIYGYTGFTIAKMEDTPSEA